MHAQCKGIAARVHPACHVELMYGIGTGDGCPFGDQLPVQPHICAGDYAVDTQQRTYSRCSLANRELGANFDLDAFAHYAPYNPWAKRIEMHLLSRVDQSVSIAGRTISFLQGETIHTENSYKYTPDGVRTLAMAAGFVPRAMWSDPDKLFSIYWLEVP